MKPPMELPTTTTGRLTTSTTNSRRKSSHSVCEYASAGFSERPKPGMVGAYTYTSRNGVVSLTHLLTHQALVHVSV